MTETVIRVDHLSKRYHIGRRVRHDTLRDALMAPFRGGWRRERHGETIWALKDVSFEVQRGEAVGIIGRNGAGKSTLLKILSRITDPTAGRAELRGRAGSLLEVGTGFHPELTGRDNIYLSGAILGMKRAEISRRFDEIVAFAEIERFLDTPVKRYSSGMFVRLGFAVAAHLEPEILIVDEVLAVGDAAFQKKCLGKMGDVAHQGRTVLFVSHNMAAITQLCRRGVWIDQGRVQRDGFSQDVVMAYLETGITECAERSWSYPGDAPGDDRVRLMEGRVLQGEQPARIVDINTPSQIELEFVALRRLTNLVVAINLYNAEGVCLLSSADWRPNQLAPGRYRKSVTIPGRFLAEGSVSVLIQLVFYDPDIRSAIVPDALRFEAVDSDHPLSVRGPYKGTWPGVVRPGLLWGDAQPQTRSYEPGRRGW